MQTHTRPAIFGRQRALMLVLAPLLALAATPAPAAAPSYPTSRPTTSCTIWRNQPRERVPAGRRPHKEGTGLPPQPPTIS
jgi:hypothetical protein